MAIDKIVSCEYNKKYIIENEKMPNSTIVYNNRLLTGNFIGTKVIKCNNKTMLDNIKIGNRTLKCKYWTMLSDLIITSKDAIIFVPKPELLRVEKTYAAIEYTNEYVTPDGVIMTGLNKGTNSGTYTATYSLPQGYFWEDGSRDDITVALVIAQRSISGATITLGASLTYTRSSQTLAVNSVIIDGLTATYQTSGNTGTNAGSYTLTCSGTGNFTGSQTKLWSIAPYDLNGGSIASVSSSTYTGSAQTPTPAVTALGVTLTSGTDFTYGYSNNTNVGTATVIANGKGNYTGSKMTTWAITKLSLTIPSLSNTSKTYTGSSQSPTVNNFNSSWETQGGTASATNVNSYTVTWNLKDTSNTQWSDGGTSQKSGTWSISRASVGAKPTGTTFNYNGSAKSPYSIPTGVTSSGTTSATNGGKYKAYYTPDSNHKWSDDTTVTVTVSWTIQYVWNRYNYVNSTVTTSVTNYEIPIASNANVGIMKLASISYSQTYFYCSSWTTIDGYFNSYASSERGCGLLEYPESYYGCYAIIALTSFTKGSSSYFVTGTKYTVKQSKGSYIDQVTSTSSSTDYPADGMYGNYWFTKTW